MLETCSLDSLTINDGRDRAAEATLVARARNGDSAAFSMLCEKYRKRVWRVVASVTRGGGDTDDLAQEAIIRAYGALKGYRADASFEAWLCRIALNAAHDYHRSAWRRRVLLWDRSEQSDRGGEMPDGRPGSLDVALSPHNEAERREVQKRVRQAVATLGTKERVPIWLIYFEEFTLAEVARLEEVPESTVRSRVKAGLKRLERVLGDLNLSPEDDGNGWENLSRSSPQPKRMSAPQADWKECKV